MNIELELQIIDRIATCLDGFERKAIDLYQFRCPLCGDSQRKRYRRRGYLYQNKNTKRIAFKCHNCQISLTLKQFVERVDRTAYDEFYREDETVDHVQSADDPNCPSDTLYKHPTEPKPDTNVSESCRSNLPEPIRPLDLRSFDRAAHCEAVMRAVLQDQLAVLLDELAYLYRFGAVSLVRRLRWWYGTTLSEAEIQDACGDAWLAVLEKIQAGHYREISEGLVWKSARRRVLNAIRDRRFREKALRRRYNDCQHQRRTDLESHSPDSRMCSEIDMRRLVDRLPDGEREAISAHFWCGTTASEIAAALGIAEKAAQKRIERGVRRLRPRL